MSNKKVICVGDTTTHGGVVISGISSIKINGRPVASVGKLVVCPLCKGVFPIISGSNMIKYNGIKIATEGMKTACGAKLVSTQSTVFSK